MQNSYAGEAGARQRSIPRATATTSRGKISHLFGAEGLAGKVVAARVEAPLDEVLVKCHEVLHLGRGDKESAFRFVSVIQS